MGLIRTLITDETTAENLLEAPDTVTPHRSRVAAEKKL